MAPMRADHVPEIPGYRVLRPLGRGGMASVYLAVQESVDREVALKIMAPQLSADPSFGERFLREARIAAKLHHRHVVSIFDVGVHNGFHYCTMEYLPGGAVMRRGSPPLALKPSLRCVREIAQALNYAHEKGFIHRDVKPDNILLREDGTCVLGDFGIARAADSGTIMTKTGSVVGTPHYMSPEQLRGRAIDGRADLYSLGVVFYQLVTGKVPYEASDSLAVGIMHMTAPLPQLPAEYRILQPILDRMLAKEPADRFQTGAEIDAALAEAEKAMASGRSELPGHRVAPPARTEAADPRDERSTRIFDPQNALRTEPQIGRLDRLEDAELRAPPRAQTQFSRAHQAPPPPRRGLLVGLLLLAMLAGLGYWQRPLVSAWVQQWLKPPAIPELDRADQALADGRLHGDSGEDALALYVSVLLLAPDNARARSGVAETSRRLYAELAAGPPDPIRIEAIARRLTGVPGYAAEAERYRALLKADSGAVQALARARAAESAGRLDGAGGALAEFAAAQAQEASSTAAAEGIERVGRALLAQARTLLAAGDLSGAERVQRELAAVSGTAALAGDLARDIQARRAAAVPDESVRIAALLDEAGQLTRQGRLVEPRGRSAADRYREVLALAPAQAQARAGLARVAVAALEQAQAAIEAREFDRASALVERIRTLAPRTAGLADAKERIADARAAAKASSPEAVAAHDKLVREGELALSSEQLMEPAGDSAYDKFRSALAINPRSEAARAGMAALAQALRIRIEASLKAGRPTRAEGELAALETVDPRFETRPLKDQVARVYAENGLRSLEGGSVEDARFGLAAAERLNPGDPTAARLRSALETR